MDWMLEKCTRYLYVLELANDKFYVGQSKDPDKRIRKHFNGSGSAWTRLHPPVKELTRSRLEYVDYRMGELAENRLVLQLMHQHGYQNVRGGFFSNTNVEHVEKGLISHGYGLILSAATSSECLANTECILVPRLPSNPSVLETVTQTSSPTMQNTEYFLFVLTLEDDCYYVGYSSKPDVRIKRYFSGKGATWTALHKPVGVLTTRSLGLLCESDAATKAADATLSMMKLFGWRNVRGAAWKSVDPDITFKQLRTYGYVPSD